MEDAQTQATEVRASKAALEALTTEKDLQDQGFRLLLSYSLPLVVIVGVVVAFVIFVRRVDVQSLSSGEILNVNRIGETPLEKELKTVLPKEDTIVNVLQELQIISLVDRTGQGYFGNGSREMRDGLFSVSVVANLPDAEIGTYYEAWIQRAYPFQMISLGRMAKNQQGRYAMSYRQEKNLLDFEHLVVTQEQDDQNSSPSDLTIVEGSFTED